MEMLYTGKAFKLEKIGSVGVLWFDLEGEKINKLSPVPFADLTKIADEIIPKSNIKALVLLSKKPGAFVVGADLNLIQSLKKESEALEATAKGQAVFSKIEDLKIPTLAAIEGPCMGGGTELSLACKYRVCSDSEKTIIAVPEVKLGFLPGWGGTYRLPLLLGLPNALDMILTGKNIRSDKALKIGLVDLVIPSIGFAEKAIALGAALAEGKRLPGAKGRVVSFQEKMLSNNFIGRSVVFNQARSGVMKQTRGHYPAPLKIIDVLSKYWGASREKFLAAESRAFADLWKTSESKNLVNLFFMMEAAKKNTGSTLSEAEIRKLTPIKEVGILGAGVMGGGIAAQGAIFGIRSVLRDLNFEAVAKALAHARGIFDKDVKKKRIKAVDRDNRMGLIRGQIDFSGFGALDLVIEAVVENIDVKKKVLGELEGHVYSSGIIGTNTSSLSVTEMAKALKDPSRFVGIHFFNPVEKMPLVEIIRHPSTSEEVTARAVAYAKAIGKTPVVVKDGPGFLVNRLLLPWLNEAAYMVLEGFKIETLDRVAKDFGMPMGPCELIDEVGIDVASKVGHILEDGFGERAKAASVTDKILKSNPEGSALKRLGRKSGLGFYKWEKPGGKRLEADVDAINQILFNGSPPSQPAHTAESLVHRMFFPMINEAARALDEGIAASAQELDLAMIFGTGFPPFKGGLCRYADSVGLDKIVAELGRLESLYGARMKPSEALKKRSKFY